MSDMHVGGRSTVFKMIVKECWHYNDKRECQKKVTQRHREAGFRRVTFMTAIYISRIVQFNLDFKESNTTVFLSQTDKESTQK